jgi:hypothetical protein
MGAARMQPLEGLEKPVDLGGRDDRPGAGHRQDGVAVLGSGRDFDAPAGDVVAYGVADQVGGQPFYEEGITVEVRGLGSGLDVQPQAADPGAGGCQDRAGDGRQVHGLALAEAALAAGQGEQRLDEAFLLGVGGEYFPGGGAPRLGGGAGVVESDLQHGALSGDGGAQLVGGVGDEVSLGLEGGFEACEQVIKGVAESPELVGRAVQAEAFVQVAGRDPAGGGGDRSQRAQDPAGHDPAERDGHHGDDRQGDGGPDQQLSQDRLD